MNLDAMTKEFLKGGGKVAKLAGFTEVAPMPAAEHPEPKKKAKTLKPADTVTHDYFVRALGLSKEQLFGHGSRYKRFLPKPALVTRRGAVFDRDEADIGIAKVIEVRRLGDRGDRVNVGWLNTVAKRNAAELRKEWSELDQVKSEDKL